MNFTYVLSDLFVCNFKNLLILYRLRELHIIKQCKDRRDNISSYDHPLKRINKDESRKLFR